MLYQIIPEEPDPLLTLNPELPGAAGRGGARHAAQGPRRSATPRWTTSAASCGDIHDALRRSRSRSALPQPPGARARRRAPRCATTWPAAAAHLEAGRPPEAVREAGGGAGRSTPPARRRRRSPGARPASCGRTAAPARRPPIRGASAGGGPAGAGRRRARRRRRPGRALAELALIAPDDAARGGPAERGRAGPVDRTARGAPTIRITRATRMTTLASRQKRVGLHLPLDVDRPRRRRRAVRRDARARSTSAAAACASRPPRDLPMGSRLDLRIQLPPAAPPPLRRRRASTRVRAVVCRVERLQGAAIARIGRAFPGRDPPDDAAIAVI